MWSTSGCSTPPIRPTSPRLARRHARKRGRTGALGGRPVVLPATIVGTYDPEGLLPHLLGDRHDRGALPADPAHRRGQPTDRGVCVIVPCAPRSVTWGLLAVVGRSTWPRARDLPTLGGFAVRVPGIPTSARDRTQERLYDALTRLPNRQLFLERLEHASALWQRSGIPFAVLSSTSTGSNSSTTRSDTRWATAC